MTSQPKVAALLITHNSDNFLNSTLQSIARQSRPVDIRVAVDDFSTDSSVQLLTDAGFAVAASTSTSSNTSTRIAHNFLHGVRLAVNAGAQIVILGDHDDVWHANRVEHQVQALVAEPLAAMIASDGFLIDEHDAAVPGTIRQQFPVPEDFATWSSIKQLSYAIRHSVATGGASAIRPEALGDWAVPAGWLHDRWWSLSTLRQGKLIIDRTPVIDYRLSDTQQVGLDDAYQGHPVRWLGKKTQNFRSTARRAVDLSRTIRH